MQWDALQGTTHICTLTHSKRQYKVTSPLTGVFLEYGRKPENLVESYTNKKTCETRTQDSNLSSCSTRAPWSCEAATPPAACPCIMC